jgi:DNA polymerase III subunit beta
LINGNYPEYSQVLPKKYEIEVIVKKNDLIDAIKIASLVANSQNSEIKITGSLSKHTLTVSSESLDAGDNISTVKAEITGGDFEVIFNSRYISEGVGVFLGSDEKVVMKLNQKKSPVLIKSLGGDGKEDLDFSYVVMPIIKQ